MPLYSAMQLVSRFGSRLLSSASKSKQLSGYVYDVVIVGSGLLGTSTGIELLSRYPKLSVAIIERDQSSGLYQSRTKGGIIYPGFFETPGSLKAKTCANGSRKVLDYLVDKDVPKRNNGMLVVAKNQNDEFRLNEYYERSQKNGCKDVSLISGDKIKEIEPGCVGSKALYSPHSGAVDFFEFNKLLVQDYKDLGGCLVYGSTVWNLSESDYPDYPVLVETPEFYIKSKYAIVCAGDGADLLVEQIGVDTSNFTLMPVLSTYLLVHPEKKELVQGNIFRVPAFDDPFPMMHISRVCKDYVLYGPSFFFTPQRYYRFGLQLNMIRRMLKYPALLSYFANYFPLFLKSSFNSIFLRAQARQLQAYVPGVEYRDIFRAARNINILYLDNEGKFIDDYMFVRPNNNLRDRIVCMLNTSTPAGGSCFGVADEVIDQLNVDKEFGNPRMSNFG